MENKSTCTIYRNHKMAVAQYNLETWFASGVGL